MKMRLRIEANALIFGFIALMVIVTALLFFQSDATRLRAEAKVGRQQGSIDVERPITNQTK